MLAKAKAFLWRYAVENGKTNLRFSPDVLRALGLNPWPGNVRELQSRVHNGQ